VRLTGEARAPLVIQADPRELSRALTNLLVNAIRHTPADGSVRGIVEAHRGQVSVVNTSEGCRFEVRLPALDAPVSQ
jgi:signal transduction histidine kinase